MAAAASLSRLLTERHIRQLASGRSFDRGEAYFDEGRVGSLVQNGDSLRASVRGSENYAVRLWAADDALQHACSCPVGADGEFCKHGVAVALAWLAGRNPQNSGGSSDVVQLDDLKPWLLQQDAATLTGWLLDAAERDQRVRERLLRHAARSRGKGVDFAAYRRAIDRATPSDEFVGYDDAFGFVENIREAAVDPLRELLQEGHAAAVIDLAERALRRVENVIENVDDSDGNFGSLLDELQDIHFAACDAARPDPEALAARLFDWEISDGGDVFYGAAETYADILGEKGLAVYRARAEARWQSLPALRPGERESRTNDRFRLTSIMEALARTSGGVDALIAIKAKDLSHPYAFLQIAELCREAKRHDDALAWAERGVKAFPQHTDPHLLEFLASEYHQRGRHDDAIALGWRQFEEQPSLETCQLLKAHADRAKPSAWAMWRERALELLRERIARVKQARPSPLWSRDRSFRSTLVEIFLWEKDSDAAWREAQAGPCEAELMLRLAADREKTHPADAIPIYVRRAETLIEQKNNRAYEDAVRHLKKAKALHLTLGQPQEWAAIRARLYVEHKAKRNFMALFAGL